MIAELVGQIGRLRGQHPPDEHGLTLTIKIPLGSVQKPAAVHRCTTCALTANALGLVTDSGAVYAVQLKQHRYKRLDTLDVAGTATAFMTRLSRQLYVGCSNGDIFCYDFGSNSRLAKLPGHRTAVTALSTKSDTEQLLSASTDAVLLWDLQTFRRRRMLSSAPYGSSQAAFSPAGNVLAAAGSAGEVIVWHAKSLQEVCRLPLPCDRHQQTFAASCLSLSLDEKWLVVGCRCPATLLVYNLQQHCLQHALHLSEELYGITQVQLLPDSTSAAVLCSTGCIHFLDIQSGSFAGQLKVTACGCRATSFSLDARANSAAVVCTDGFIRLYDLAAVRAQQQKRTIVVLQQQQQHAQKMDEQQLRHLDAGTAALASYCAAGYAAGGPNKPQQVVQVLAEVSNMPAKHKAAAKPGRSDSSAIKSSASKSSASKSGIMQLQQLDSPAAALNKQKVQQLLAVFGEFPAKYRQMIWEHLLQLPHNSAAFSLLQDRGVHPAYKHLAQQMPGGARSTTAIRLQACLSQLAHWCPLFGEAGFLPRFAFPFVTLCGAKSESAFEMVASLLLNWCKGWFELFPNPPLPLLRRFLLLMSHHDHELGGHLQHLGVPLLQQLWHKVSGAMSDMLHSQSDWLVFWDHCLAAATGPGFFYQLLCAYLVAQRRMLLAVQDEQHLVRLWVSRPAVDIHQVVKMAYKLEEATPSYASLGLRSFSPLPPAADGAGYPLFNEYPAGSVELQAMERQRIQEAEEALIRRRQVVAELEQRSKQVAFDSAALTAQRQQLAALDSQRRAAMRAIDDSLSAAGARLNDRSKEEKLKQIRLVEEAYQASLSSLRAEWSSELAALKADIEHKRRLAAAALKARQEEEDLKALEFQAQQSLWALQQEEMAAAGTSALQDAAAAQAAALAAEQQRKNAEWQAEDEVRVLRQQHETARRARLVAAAEQEAAKQAAKGLLLTQELQAQEELLKVERQRRLRQLAEDEAELTAKQLQLQVERQAVLAAAGQEAVQQAAQQHKQQFMDDQQERMSAVDHELQALKQRQAELHAAAADIGSAARVAAAEQQLAQLEQAMSRASEEQEAQVQHIMQELKQDKKEHDHVMSVLSTLRAETARGNRPAAMAASGRASPARAAEPAASLNSSAASLEARLAALTQEFRAQSAAAAPVSELAATKHTPAAAGVSSRDTYDVTDLQEVLSSLTAEVAGRPPAAEEDDRAGKAQTLSQHQARRSTDSVDSLVRRVESMDLQHALRAAQAANAATAASKATTGSRVSDSPAASSTTSSSSVAVSQELEQLLAETEAEVQRELAYKAAAEARLKVKQLRPQTAPGARALYSAGRLHPVYEEPCDSSSTASPAAAAAIARSAARLPGSVTHSPAASPAASAASSPTRRPLIASSLAPRAAAAGDARSSSKRPSSSSDTPAVGSGSPAAVKLALSGLEPLTHHGRVVTGLADLLKRAPQSASSSSGSSSGSSRHAKRQQQAAGDRPLAAALISPETPSSTASMLTASSGSIYTSPPAQAKVVTAAMAAESHAALHGGAVMTQAEYEDLSGARDYPLYEAVLLGVPQQQQPMAATVGNATAAGNATASYTSSPSSTEGSSSQPSSRSLSLGAAAEDLGEHGERETPMLGFRSRARTTGAYAQASIAFAAAAAQEAADLRGSTRSRSEGGFIVDAPEVAPAGHVAAGSRMGSRVSSSGLNSGLDASGRVSAELRQSSSATSEELESLLQQLAVYEERLLQAEPSVVATSPDDAVNEGASTMGTSMASVSWSQTLAGLASLLPQG